MILKSLSVGNYLSVIINWRFIQGVTTHKFTAPLVNSLSTIALLKVAALVCMLLYLTGCATGPSLENQAAVAVDNNLAQLKKWRITGKIAWITPQERTSAYMNWQQRDAQMQFTLSNVLGITLASLSYDGELATLQADSQQYQNPSPSALIYQTTGWQVPLTSLSSWVKGAPSHVGRVYAREKQVDEGNNARIMRYENGLVKQIRSVCASQPNLERCDEWTIDYTGYVSVIINDIQYQLPTNITMVNAANQATIKMRISEWSE